MDAPTRDTADPFRGSKTTRSGAATWDRLRGPDFLRLGPDVYLGAAVEVGVRARVRALHLWSRGDGVVAGPLAALAWGAECPWTDAEIVVGGHRRLALPSVRVRTDRLRPDEIADRHGAPLTTPLRTACDLARRPPLVEAVAAVDALARSCRFDGEQMRVLLERHPGARGIVAARRVLALMDPRAESLMETRTRLVFVLRDVPAPIPQYEVHLRDGRIVRLDLAWPEVPAGRRRLAVEYDGPSHRTIAGQNRDHLRDAALDAIGWETIHVSSAQVLDDALADELAERVLDRVT